MPKQAIVPPVKQPICNCRNHNCNRLLAILQKISNGTLMSNLIKFIEFSNLRKSGTLEYQINDGGGGGGVGTISGGCLFFYSIYLTLAI